jgi:hypothetical protein
MRRGGRENRAAGPVASSLGRLDFFRASTTRESQTPGRHPG